MRLSGRSTPVSSRILRDYICITHSANAAHLEPSLQLSLRTSVNTNFRPSTLSSLHSTPVGFPRLCRRGGGRSLTGSFHSGHHEIAAGCFLSINPSVGAFSSTSAFPPPWTPSVSFILVDTTCRCLVLTSLQEIHIDSTCYGNVWGDSCAVSLNNR